MFKHVDAHEIISLDQISFSQKERKMCFCRDHFDVSSCVGIFCNDQLQKESK